MTPADVYTERLAQHSHLLDRFDRLQHRIGTTRLALAISFLALAWACITYRALPPAWLLLPASLFVAALLYHQRIRAQRSLAQRAVLFYRKGIERLQGKDDDSGPGGDQFLDQHHLYGADLDLFGKNSLYQRLSLARTPMGKSVLAQWLLQPANRRTILDRQACIAELRGRLNLREDLATVGDAARVTLEPTTLTRWLDSPDQLSQLWLEVSAIALTVLALATATVWGIWGLAFPFLVVLVLEASLQYALRNHVQNAVAGVEHAYEDLKLLAALLQRLETESFEAEPLRALKLQLTSQGFTASNTLSKLATLVNFVEARRTPLLGPLLLPLMYRVHSALAAERWRRRHGQAVHSWISVLGEFEALQSLAGYSFERPDDTFPIFSDGAATFRALGLGHPLIPAAVCVRNDVDLAGSTRVLLVSGSNMSGKSTLLRSVGINTVLAMAGAPVCAVRLELTPLMVGASIRVNDSLHEGSSRFYAEITRLRQLFEPCSLPLLFLLDELLQGTNSTDRRIGAQGVVRALVERGAIGLVSTHDLALAVDTALPAGALKNVHFQDALVDGQLQFDFTLRDGLVTKSNGIELMRAIGLEV
jgi:MutS domain V/MutS domain III